MGSITSSDLEYRYSGGHFNNDGTQSLGGAMSYYEIPNATLDNVFDRIGADKAGAGYIDYRCIYIANTSATYPLNNATVAVSQATTSTDTEIEVGLDPAGIGDGTVTGVATTVTSPGGVATNYSMFEGSGTNDCLYSFQFDHATWFKPNSTVPATPYQDPARTNNARAIVASSGIEQIHTIYQTISGATPSEDFTSSFYIKPGLSPYAKVRSYISGSFIECYAEFDLDNGVIGSQTHNAGISGEYINGYYRCWISCTDSGSLTSVNTSVFILDSIGDDTFIGDGTSNYLYVYGAQFEEGCLYPSSLIGTASSAVTRLADSASWVGSDGNIHDSAGYATASFFALEPSASYIRDNRQLISFTGTSQEITVYIEATTGYLCVYIDPVTGGPYTKKITTSVVDGDVHSFKVEWDVSSDVILTLDGATSVTQTIGPVAAFSFTTISAPTTDGSNNLVSLRIYDSSDTLLFSALDGLSGVDAMQTTLSLNSVQQTPTVLYRGHDATPTAWTAQYGPNLSIAGSDDDPVIVGGYGNDGYSEAVQFSDSQSNYYTAAGGFCTTGDLVLVMMYRASSDDTNRTYMISGRPSASGSRLAVADEYNSTSTRVVVSDGVTAYTLVHNVGQSPDEYRFVTIGFNRDEASTNGLFAIINNYTDTGYNGSAISGSLSGTDIYVGCRTSDNYTYNMQLEYVATYDRANWIQAGSTGRTEVEDLHEELLFKFCNLWPVYAAGTARPTFTRAIRASADTHDPVDEKWFVQRLGRNMPRSFSYSGVFQGPSGVTFGSSATLSGTLGPGQAQGIWLKRTVTAGTSTITPDSGKIKVSGDN
jgi:hypothetical protein